ncbi:MAG: hypothetical protein RL141_481 [Candidatus Parcubacteria bacterium]|jgi:hypothetical protein
MINAEINLTTTASFFSCDSGRWLAKAATRLRAKNGIARNVAGFAIDTDKDTAIMRAQYELIERFWAIYPFALGLKPTDKIRVRMLYSQKRKDVPASEILLSFGKKNGDADSTGLAHGHNFEMAQTNAIREMIERHISTVIWYTPEPLLIHMSKSISELQGVVYTYTQQRWRDIPYAISFFYSEAAAIFVAGAAVCASIQEALLKAEREALMIALCLFNKEVPISIDTSAFNRYSSLRGKESFKRWNYVQKKIMYKSAQQQSMISDPLNQLLSVLGNQAQETYMSTLHTEPNSCVVKVRNPYSLRPKNAFHPPFTPTDPFC